MTMTTTHSPAEVFPPGEYLRDELEERGWSVTEFAQILGRPLQAISEILNGKKEITADTAVDLASALGTSPEVWLNLQSAFRLHQVHTAAPERSLVKRRSRLRSFGPIAEMRRRGWVADTDDLDVLERSVLSLFDAASLDEMPALAFAARRSNDHEVITPLQVAWLARVKQLAQSTRVARFDLDRLPSLAGSLPMRLRDGPSVLTGLSASLAEYGVALVVETGLKGSKLDGAALFTKDGVPIVGLTARYDRFDSFVFTLLHELAHIALGHVTPSSGPLLDEDLEGEGSSVYWAEDQANEQASRWIFPDGFDPPEIVSTAVIAGLARRYGIHPSLVIGRLQRDGVIDWSRLRNHIPRVRRYVDGMDQ